VCHAIFVLPSHFLSAADEKARYDHHQNDPNDEGYRNFLMRIVTPLLSGEYVKLADGARGIDYGSGPSATLSLIMREKGFAMDNYDPFYANQ
jgi:hypothetical protein